jgi:hypothetical protein
MWRKEEGSPSSARERKRRQRLGNTKELLDKSIRTFERNVTISSERKFKVLGSESKQEVLGRSNQLLSESELF